MQTNESRRLDYTFLLTDVEWMCSLKGMARFKEIVKGISEQTARRMREVGMVERELSELLPAYQRYRELSARVGPESESARIGMALWLNVPMKTHPELNAYDVPLEDRMRIEDEAKNAVVFDSRALDLGQYPLWKIMREVLRQVPEMRVYELEAHLKAFGVPVARSAIESSLKTHRKQFRVRPQGREKFVAWKEGANETASTK